MKQVTIHDLLSMDSPEVKRALKIRCGMCGAKVDDRCRSLNPGFAMVSVVHFARATSHYESKGAA